MYRLPGGKSVTLTGLIYQLIDIIIQKDFMVTLEERLSAALSSEVKMYK